MNKRIIALILICAMAACLCGGLADEGTTADPVVTLSYINETYIPQFLENSQSRIDAALADEYNNAFASLALEAGRRNAAAAMADMTPREAFGPVALKKGDIVYAYDTLEISLITGSSCASGQIFLGESSFSDGTALAKGTVYTAPASSGITVTSEVATVYLTGLYTLIYSDAVDYTSFADALFTMGLFKGRTDGYALDVGATRAEGLVMFLRLIGEEDDALAFTGPQPFSDASWADRYIAYAYHMGYTKGESATRFGTDSPLSAAHYVTFLLRSLGYIEGEDFAWKTVIDDALMLGVITQSEAQFLETSFKRAQVAYLSYWALFLTLNGQSDSILTRLINTNSISEDTALRAMAVCKAIRIN